MLEAEPASVNDLQAAALSAKGEEKSASRQEAVANVARRPSAPASALPPKTEITSITTQPKQRDDRGSPLRAMVEAAMSRTQKTDELLGGSAKRDLDRLASSRVPDN